MKKILTIAAASVIFVINANASVTPTSSASSTPPQPRQMFVLDRTIDGHPVQISADDPDITQSASKKLGDSLMRAPAETQTMAQLPGSAGVNPELSPLVLKFAEMLAELRVSGTDASAHQIVNILRMIDSGKFPAQKEASRAFQEGLKVFLGMVTPRIVLDYESDLARDLADITSLLKNLTWHSEVPRELISQAILRTVGDLRTHLMEQRLNPGELFRCFLKGFCEALDPTKIPYGAYQQLPNVIQSLKSPLLDDLPSATVSLEELKERLKVGTLPPPDYIMDAGESHSLTAGYLSLGRQFGKGIHVLYQSADEHEVTNFVCKCLSYLNSLALDHHRGDGVWYRA